MGQALEELQDLKGEVGVGVGGPMESSHDWMGSVNSDSRVRGNKVYVPGWGA